MTVATPPRRLAGPMRGLGHNQRAALVVLERGHPLGATTADIAREIDTDHHTAYRTLRALERRRLISRMKRWNDSGVNIWLPETTIEETTHE